MKKLKQQKGITLVALVITIIILVILASISINMILGNNGLLNKVQTASNETKKSQATETMNLKITNIQISSYAEKQELPNLQYLADKLCEDNDMEYVLTASKKHASLDKIDVTNISSIFTKLKEYPYEFEINSSLQLASIDGIKIASEENNKTSLNNIVDNNLLFLYNNIISNMNKDNSIDLLLNDSTLFPIVLLVSENVDYIVENPDIFLNKIIRSENAVKSLAKNEYARNKIKQNETYMAALEKCDYAYEEWIQPVMSSNTKVINEGTITIKSTGDSATDCPAWGAMDGKLSNGEGGYWWYSSAPAYWQVEFPYKLRIKSIDFYNQYSTYAPNMVITARLYTNSQKTTPIGNEFSASSAWQKITINGINENEILTNSIYLYKTVGAAGIGELVINADKFIF